MKEGERSNERRLKKKDGKEEEEGERSKEMKVKKRDGKRIEEKRIFIVEVIHTCE